MKKILILCMFQTVLQYIFFYIGLLNTSGVKASVIEGANVFVAIIIVCFVLRLEKLTAAKIAGCIVGFAGVVTINLTGSGFDPSMKFTGEGFILISTVAYAFSSALLKKFGTDEDPLLLSGWQFFAGGLIMTAAGAAFGGSFSLPSGKAAAMLVYLAFISAAAYSMWAMLLRYNDVSRIAVFGFMNPVFGVILSALLLDEGESAFSAKACVSLLLVCAGIYIVNKKTKEVLTDEYSG